jgi:NAD(P)-dependent dehydrogenase (short-subunit alcohol dehydrogenase family)
VTGGSRGIGRGIAWELGAAGATVYVTGRSVETADNPVGGTITEAAQEVTDAGGVGIAARCDHTDDDQVEALFDRVRSEQGHLDILVNNASSAQSFNQWMRQPIWEQGAGAWRDVIDGGVRIHYMATVFGTRLMTQGEHGVVVNISSVGAVGYLGSAVYGVGKAATDKLTGDCAKELRKYNIAAVSLWPGMVVTESFDLHCAEHNLDLSGVRQSMETPRFTGRAVVALATDRDVISRTGKAWVVADLARVYGFTDVEGNLPPVIADIETMERVSGIRWRE